MGAVNTIVIGERRALVPRLQRAETGGEGHQRGGRRAGGRARDVVVHRAQLEVVRRLGGQAIQQEPGRVVLPGPAGRYPGPVVGELGAARPEADFVAVDPAAGGRFVPGQLRLDAARLRHLEAGRRGRGQTVAVDLQAPRLQRRRVPLHTVGDPQRPGPGGVLAEMPRRTEPEIGVDAEGVPRFMVAAERNRQRRDRVRRRDQFHPQVPERLDLEVGDHLDEFDELDVRADLDGAFDRRAEVGRRPVRDGLVGRRFHRFGPDEGRQVHPAVGEVHGRLRVDDAEAVAGIEVVRSRSAVLRGAGAPAAIAGVVLARRCRQDQLHVAPGQRRVRGAHQGRDAGHRGRRRGRATETVGVAAVVAGRENARAAATGGSADPQVGAVLRVPGLLAYGVHRADRDHAVVVRVPVEVCVVVVAAVAAGPDVDDALAAIAAVDAIVDRHLPDRRGRLQARVVGGTPTVVGHRRSGRVAGHRVRLVLVGVVVQHVVAVERRARRDAAPAEVVIPCPDHARHPGAMGLAVVEQAVPAGVVVAPRRVDVLHEIRMGFVQSAVDDGDADAGTPVAPGPDLLDLDVLARRGAELARVLQVPLATGQRVGEGSGEFGAVVDDVVHDLVFEHTDRVAAGGVAGGAGHLDVVGSRLQAIREHEAHRTAGRVGVPEHLRLDRVGVRVLHRPVDCHRVAHGPGQHVGRCGQVDLEVVRVGRRVDPAEGELVETQLGGLRGPASGHGRHRLDAERVGPRLLLREGLHLHVPGAGRQLPADQKRLHIAEHEAVVVRRDRCAVAVEKLPHHVRDRRSRTDDEVRFLRQGEPEVVLVAPLVEHATANRIDRDGLRVVDAGTVDDCPGVDRVRAGKAQESGDFKVVRSGFEGRHDQEVQSSGPVIVGQEWVAVLVEKRGDGVEVAVVAREQRQGRSLVQRELEDIGVSPIADGRAEGNVQRQVEGRRPLVPRLDRSAGNGSRPGAVRVGHGPYLDVVAGVVAQPGEHVVQRPLGPGVLLYRPVRVVRFVGAGQHVADIVGGDVRHPRGRLPDHGQGLVPRVDCLDHRRGGRIRLGGGRYGQNEAGDQGDQR